MKTQRKWQQREIEKERSEKSPKNEEKEYDLITCYTVHTHAHKIAVFLPF